MENLLIGWLASLLTGFPTYDNDVRCTKIIGKIADEIKSGLAEQVSQRIMCRP